MKSKLLFAGVAAATLMGQASGVMAETVVQQKETVHTKTLVQTKDMEDVNKINFKMFDLNEDGEYSMEEVGEKLFYIFDTDGNEVIDNIEWDNRNVYTITPMQKETFKYVDTDNDGVTEETSYNYETFYKASGLIKFDENEDGLSASEFIGAGFESMDGDEDKVITLKEWTDVYLDTRHPHNKPENYQQD